MITGDHPGTAAAIARRLAICDDRQAVPTGAGLEQLSEDAFAQRVRVDTGVCASQSTAEAASSGTAAQRRIRRDDW